MKAESLAKLLEQRAQDLIIGAQSAMREVLDDIGRDATDGMIALDEKQKNTGNRLAIRTGDLYRSLVKGTDSNSVRKIKTSNNVIIGTIGSKAKSKKGFFYPTFHEYGGLSGVHRFSYFLRNAITLNEQNLRDKLIKKIGNL